MVSIGLGDFLVLLLTLADQGAEGTVTYGRCPDCKRPISTLGLTAMIGELLVHELQYHPEHAEHQPGLCAGDIEHPAHGDDAEG
jgi:hypothetical protein